MEHIWLIPLIWSIVVTVLLVWFLFSLEGEDQMGAPLVLLAWLIAVPGSWLLYGAYHLIAWAF
jgi:hypothetical protein